MILVALIVTLLPLSLFAGSRERCTQLVRRLSSKAIVIATDGSVSADDLDPILGVSEKIEILTRKLRKPKELKILVSQQSEVADHDNGVIRIPITLIEKSPKGKLIVHPPAHSLYVLAHEIGHAYFDANVAHSKLSGLNSIDRSLLLGAYTELFADLMAVLYSGDPNAVFKSLHNPQHEGISSHELRRFDIKLSNFNLDELQEPHVALAEVREFCGKYLIDEPRFRNTPETILSLIIEAINIEVHRRLALESGLEEPNSITNHKFVETLSSLLKN